MNKIEMYYTVQEVTYTVPIYYDVGYYREGNYSGIPEKCYPTETDLDWWYHEHEVSPEITEDEAMYLEDIIRLDDYNIQSACFDNWRIQDYDYDYMIDQELY